MSPTRPPKPRRPTRLLNLLPVCVCVLAACGTPEYRPRPRLAGEPRDAAAPDPSRSPYHGWDAVDRAVKAGAIEHLVVATPVETIGVEFRIYRLLGPRDQPGELRVHRKDGALDLTVRLGRFGEPELERAVLESVRQALAAPPED